MRVPTTGPTGRADPLRRKTIETVWGPSETATAEPARSVQDTASVLGIPPEEMTDKVRNAIMMLMSEVNMMRKDLELAHRKISDLEEIADQDSLLAIANRRAFVREMTRMLSYSQRYGIDSALIYLDLNDLKKINDTYGHKAGDMALSHMARLITINLRDSDIVGRLGGDEFGVILPKATEKVALVKAQSLAQNIFEQPLVWKNVEIPLKMAYGVHSLCGHESVDQALDKADRNMYAHKKSLKQE